MSQIFYETRKRGSLQIRTRWNVGKPTVVRNIPSLSASRCHGVHSTWRPFWITSDCFVFVWKNRV